MNICTFTARLTKDPRGYTSSGKEIKVADDDLRFTSFNIVVNEGYGENKSSMLVNCKISDFKVASWALSKLYKGVEVLISGSLYEYSYTDRATNKRVTRVGLKVKDCEITRHTKEYLEYKNMGDSDSSDDSRVYENRHSRDTYGNEVDSEGFLVINPDDSDLPFD